MSGEPPPSGRSAIQMAKNLVHTVKDSVQNTLAPEPRRRSDQTSERPDSPLRDNCEVWPRREDGQEGGMPLNELHATAWASTDRDVPDPNQATLRQRNAALSTKLKTAERRAEIAEQAHWDAERPQLIERLINRMFGTDASKTFQSSDYIQVLQLCGVTNCTVVRFGKDCVASGMKKMPGAREELSRRVFLQVLNQSFHPQTSRVLVGKGLAKFPDENSNSTAVPATARTTADIKLQKMMECPTPMKGAYKELEFADEDLLKLMRGQVEGLHTPRTEGSRENRFRHTFEWDYAIVLPNPDHPANTTKKLIGKEQAAKIFKTSFRGEPIFTMGVNRQEECFRKELSTYLAAYALLRPGEQDGGDDPNWRPLDKDLFDDNLMKEFEKKKACHAGGAYEPQDVDEANLNTPQDIESGVPRKASFKVERQGSMSFFNAKKTRQQYIPNDASDMTCPDFTSLIRNVLITKLVEHCSLTVESVFSQDGKYIYLLLAADEEDLKCQAEHTRYPVAIDLMIADPEAFEPCDRWFRPVAETFFGDNDEEVEDEYKHLIHVLEANTESREETVTFVTSAEVESLIQSLNKDGVLDDPIRLESRWLPEGTEVLTWGDRPIRKVETDLLTFELPMEAKIRYEAIPFDLYDYHRQKLEYYKALPELRKHHDLSERRAENNGIRGRYLHYLKLRQQGYMALRALDEANKCTDMKGPPLQCLWDRLKINTPPQLALSPYSTRAVHDLWKRYNSHNLLGEPKSSVFSSADRLLLMNQIIAKQIDLLRLIELGYVIDFFPLPDAPLRDLCLRPINNILFNTSIPASTAAQFVRMQYALPLGSQAPMDISEPEKWKGGEEQRAEERGLKGVFNRFERGRALEKHRGWKSCARALLRGLIPPIFTKQLPRADFFYFGQKLCLYFIFVEFMSRYTAIPALGGIILAIINAAGVSGRVTALFNTLLLSWWGAWVLARWNHGEKDLLIHQGILPDNPPSFFEPDRLAFKGFKRRSPVTGVEGELFFSNLHRIIRMTCSGMVSLVITVLMLACVVACGYLGVWLNRDHDPVADSTMINVINILVACLNFVQIYVFGEFYRWAGMKLTTWENHRTYAAHNASYATKSVIFLCLNAFASTIYNAMFKNIVEGSADTVPQTSCANLARWEDIHGRWVDLCTTPDECSRVCTHEYVNKQLLVLLLLQLFKCFFRFGRDFAKHVLARKKTSNDSKVLPLVAMLDVEMQQPKYGEATLAFDGTIDDYSEILVMFGFLCLFGVTLPFSGLLMGICISLEYQLDRYRMKAIRRPMPFTAISIGLWEKIINGILVIAVVTNAILLVTVVDVPRTFGRLVPESAQEQYKDLIGDSSGRLVFIVAIVMVLLMLKLAIFQLVSNESTSMQTVANRIEFIVDQAHNPRKSANLEAHEEQTDFAVKTCYNNSVLQGRWGVRSHAEISEENNKSPSPINKSRLRARFSRSGSNLGGVTSMEAAFTQGTKLDRTPLRDGE